MTPVKVVGAEINEEASMLSKLRPVATSTSKA
jgi:hypothetical protein